MVEALYCEGCRMLVAYTISFILSWISLSTYWDDVFGSPNFYAHGLGIGLALIPLTFIGVPIWWILIRSICLSLGMGVWSSSTDVDWLEEMGRGALIIATLPILFM